MKITDAEINAANYQLTRYEEGRGNIQAVKEALEAAYTIRRARKQAKRERQRKETQTALEYATSLAVALHAKHYAEDAPNWEPLPDIWGVISQIDNMTTGLVRKEKDKQVVENVKPVDVRPASCRFRLQDEGKPYPRSSCTACGATVMNMGKACRYGVSPSASQASLTVLQLAEDEQ